MKHVDCAIVKHECTCKIDYIGLHSSFIVRFTKKKDWKRVIDGVRPHLLYYINYRVQDLIKRCCYIEPPKKFLFIVILN